MNLFTLAITQHRTLNNSERIQHTLNVYSKILQPEVWAQWVRVKINSFEEEAITVCQDFMNSSTMKYNKIVTKEGRFKGLVHTIQDDIVALITGKSRSNAKRNFKRKVDEDEDKLTNTKRPKLKIDEPCWIRHFKLSAGVKYKVGDTNEFKGKT